VALVCGSVAFAPVAVLANIPTVAGSGLPGYAVESWYGLYAPAGTPPEVIALMGRYRAATPEEQAEVLKQLLKLGGKAQPYLPRTGPLAEAFGKLEKDAGGQ